MCGCKNEHKVNVPNCGLDGHSYSRGSSSSSSGTSGLRSDSELVSGYCFLSSVMNPPPPSESAHTPSAARLPIHTTAAALI